MKWIKISIVICLFSSLTQAQDGAAASPSLVEQIENSHKSSPKNKPALFEQQTGSLSSFSFGPSWTSDMNNDALFYAFHLGRNWQASQQAEIRLNLDAAFASKDEGLWLTGTLGAGWVLSEDEIAPIVGGEFGFGYAHIDGAKDPAGFVLGGFAGLRLFRNANAQMSVEGFFQTLLKNENPVLAGLRLGVLF